MILDEAVPIGGFVGISVSEPLLQGGIMVSVIGYMVYLETYMALLSLLFLIPQLVFVPLMQRAINRRAEARIRTLRDVSSAMVVETPLLAAIEQVDEGRIDHVFTLNMGIYKLKYSMNRRRHGRGDCLWTRKAQGSMGRYRELVTRILGRQREIPAIRRCRELACSGDTGPIRRLNASES